MKSADAQDCDGNHLCHNLLEYVSHPQYYFTSNTTIHFLPGLHLLEQNITVSGVKNLELVGSSFNAYKGPNAIIHCNGTQVGLIFQNITKLKIQNMMIVNCGRSLPSNIWIPYTLKKITVFAALFVANVYTLTIVGVFVEASTGYGLLGLNVFGNSVVLNSKFYCNNNLNVSIDCYNQLQSKTTGGNTSRIGGNAYFAFKKKTGAYVESDLQITGSNFSHGRSESEGGGLGILIMVSSRLGGITVNVSNCTFENNVAHSGANGFICIKPTACYFCRVDHIRVIITNCNFISGHGRHVGGGLCIKSNNSPSLHVDIRHSNFSKNYAGSKGGGIAFELMNTNSFYIQILDATFSRNIASVGGGIFLLIKSNVQAPFFSSHLYLPIAHSKTQSCSVFLTNCSFRECRASTGAAVRIDNCYLEEVLNFIGYCKPSGLQTLTVFRNVVFSNNRAQHQRTLTFSVEVILFAAVLHLFNVNQITLNNIQFKNNLCGSIYALSSKIACRGHLEFHNNKAYRGGAFNLDCTSDPSLIYLYPESKLYMSNNSAEYGGAIAAREDCGASDMHMCFFQPTWSGSLPGWKLPKVILENNTATMKGNSIYVRNVYICVQQFTMLHPSTFWSIFTIHGVNQIAEHAYQVCVCLDSYAGSLPKWMKGDTCPISNAVTVYRGKSFNATVAGVSQYNYPIPTVLQTSIESGSGSARLGIRQHAQQLSYSCTNVTYSITSIEDEVTCNSSSQLRILIIFYYSTVLCYYQFFRQHSK